MVYPSHDQMVYINVNPAKVAMLTSEINNTSDSDSINNEESRYINSFFAKLVSYIKI